MIFDIHNVLWYMAKEDDKDPWNLEALNNMTSLRYSIGSWAWSLKSIETYLLARITAPITSHYM